MNRINKDSFGKQILFSQLRNFMQVLMNTHPVCRIETDTLWCPWIPFQHLSDRTEHCKEVHLSFLIRMCKLSESYNTSLFFVVCLTRAGRQVLPVSKRTVYFQCYQALSLSFTYSTIHLLSDDGLFDTCCSVKHGWGY